MSRAAPKSVIATPPAAAVYARPEQPQISRRGRPLLPLPPPARESLAAPAPAPYVAEGPERPRSSPEERRALELAEAAEQEALGIAQEARRLFAEANDDMIPMAVFLASPEESEAVERSLEGRGELVPLYGASFYVTEDFFSALAGGVVVENSPEVAFMAPDAPLPDQKYSTMTLAASRGELRLAARIGLFTALREAKTASQRDTILERPRAYGVSSAAFAATRDLLEGLPEGTQLEVLVHVVPNGACDSISVAVAQ